jgi:glycosyltransferase involved in cell wall biosynthesis
VSISAPLAPTTIEERELVTPFVSVIVPVRNRADCLRDLLDALIVQSYPASRREVIVVDNDSREDIESIVNAAAARSECNIRYLRKRNDGPAASRNRGAVLARGELLAFTDSDCLPDRDWLSNGVGAFEDGIGVVCGSIEAVQIMPTDPFFVHQIHSVTREEGLYPTANVFYRRESFLKLGGFNETTRTYPWGQPVGGDDTEFAWRVKRAGFRSAFVDGARVRHRASKVLPHEYLLNSLQAQILPRVVRSSPELRDMCLYRRYFVHKGSALFLMCVAGAALAPRRRLALALTVPWLRHTWPMLRMDAWPPRRWPRAAARLALHVPASLLLEGALVYGSIKHQRIVL